MEPKKVLSGPEYLLDAIDCELHATEQRMQELETQRREVINKYNLNKGAASAVAPTSRSQRILDAKP